MVKNWHHFVGCMLIAALSVGCKTSHRPMVKPPAPTFAQKKPLWLNQLSERGVAHKFHRTHLEIKLPIAKHFDAQPDIDKHLISVLAPVAKQLQTNQYHVAELLQYVDRPSLTQPQKAVHDKQLNRVVNALNQLNVETKIVVKSRPKLRKPNQRRAQAHGPYVAINLYQRHEGHGLVY